LGDRALAADAVIDAAGQRIPMPKVRRKLVASEFNDFLRSGLPNRRIN
jgi:hypothetical protein